jgi:hypothetical protein
VEAYTFSAGVYFDKNEGKGGTQFATSRYPNSPNADVFSTSAKNLVDGNAFSPNDFAKAVSLFQSQSISNKTGIYNNYPIQRSNQHKSLLSRFYPLW